MRAQITTWIEEAWWGWLQPREYKNDGSGFLSFYHNRGTFKEKKNLSNKLKKEKYFKSKIYMEWYRDILDSHSIFRSMFKNFNF